jgi:hypothetical protein
MDSFNQFFRKLTPRVSKRTLFFIAGIVWTFAGGMLLFRGILMMAEKGNFYYVKFVISLLSGILFYILLFSKISVKYVEHIRSIPHEKPSAFSFFDRKGYFMMLGMITLGISLRSSGLVPASIMSVVYVTMGIPLAISSVNFYKNSFAYVD